ncbi:DnaT-like ssDNA-binding domain-containing protein [Amphritea sp. HPY]|uniref:DnaT-like ssDNA-binding domain-containing protein n=1 Tax=Amphritea sp. HPY TaxID=3421652 RepID=UPI003D7C7910
MGFRFPEKPVLFYPSLAREIGSDEAILLALYHEHIQLHGLPDQSGQNVATLGRQEWLALADFWDEERLAVTTNSLVSQGYLQAAFGQGGAIRIQLQQPGQPQVMPEYEYEQEPVAVQQLPVVEQPPERNEISRRVHQAQPQVRGPAPTFGGSIGWSNRRAQMSENDFASRLDAIEEKNQKLHPMFLGWRPSKILFEMLPRHNIPADFAEQLLDEFVLYWLDKDRKESNWDQKFLAWVKREWVKKQTRDGREQRYAKDANTGVNHENTRADPREKRKRVTAAIMDIKDTDW